MIVLGLHMEHDAAAAIVKDGRVLINTSLEKITKKKKDWRFSTDIITYVLEKTGLKITDINHVAINAFKPGSGVRLFMPPKVASKLPAVFNPDTGELSGDGYHLLFPALKSYQIEPEQAALVTGEACIFNTTIKATVVNHHLAHSALAFFTSPFKTAAIFSLDASCTMGILPEFGSLYAYATGIDMWKLYSPGCMVGTMFEQRCVQLGMGATGTFKAGTLMGLAPYGKVLPQAIEFDKELTCSYWERTRAQRSDREHLFWQWMLLSGQPMPFTKLQSDGLRAMNIAASTQYIYEKSVERFVTQLYEDTKHLDIDGICLTGGSFLNCAYNGKLRAKKQFKDYFWHPACGDDGGALGAALYTSHIVLRVPRVEHKRKDVMYMGHDFKEHEKEYTHEFKIPVEKEPLNFGNVAQYLDQNKVVAWFNGKAEVGPRALCNRSFLASPKSKTMRDYLNKKVKNREWFRPFAPVILNEHRSEYFEMDYESPFMLEAVQVKPDKKDRIPAVLHIDDSARVQTLKEEDNPKMYRLLQAFYKHTGIPLLLNTSLNLGGEPVVESPKDAFELFERGNVDILVLGNFVYKKIKKST